MIPVSASKKKFSRCGLKSCVIGQPTQATRWRPGSTGTGISERGRPTNRCSSAAPHWSLPDGALGMGERGGAGRAGGGAAGDGEGGICVGAGAGVAGGAIG